MTSDTTPTFSGTSEAGASVTLFAGATNVGSTIATGGGTWSITSTKLAANTYSFTATQTDAAGNGPSVASSGLSVEINTNVPAAPSMPNLDAASDSGSSNTDNVTNDTTPTFSGTAEAGSTVELRNGTTVLGTGVATGGNWQITSSGLAAGAYAITARAINVNGPGPDSAALTVTIQTALGVTVNQASGQADPTGTSPINYTVVFTNAVTDFTSGDVTVGGTVGGTKVATVTGSGTTYNVAVTGMTTNGTVTATILAGVATDLAGNLTPPRPAPTIR